MNNSAVRPHVRNIPDTRVDKAALRSTCCGEAATPLTRGFSALPTIHTPYYDYFKGFTHTDIRRRGTTCAYPS